METRVAKNFNEQVDVLVDNAEKKSSVYTSLNKFQVTHNVQELVNELKTLLANPEYMPIFDNLRPLIPAKQQLEYDWLQPSRSGERMRTVTLQRPTTADEHLGFALRGGLEFGLGLYVTGVASGGVAERQGLRVGDQIIRINGYTLHQAVSFEVANLIKAKQFLELSVKNIGLIPEQKNKNEPITWKYVEETLSERAIQIDGIYYTAVNVSIILPISANFGCSIASHIDGAIFIKSVTEGSLAEQAGIETGDQILQVNGTVFSNISHSQAVVAMKGSRLLNITLLKKLSSKYLQFSPQLEKKPKVFKGKAKHESEIKRSRENKSSEEKNVLNDLNKTTTETSDREIKDGNDDSLSSKVPVYSTVINDDVIQLNSTNQNGSVVSVHVKEGHANRGSSEENKSSRNDQENGTTPSSHNAGASTKAASYNGIKSSVPQAETSDKVTMANTDLAEVEQIYEEPIKLIEEIKTTSPPSSPLPQDNLRELRKKFAERKLSGAKPLLKSISRSDSIEELDEEEAAENRQTDTPTAVSAVPVASQTDEQPNSRTTATQSTKQTASQPKNEDPNTRSGLTRDAKTDGVDNVNTEKERKFSSSSREVNGTERKVSTSSQGSANQWLYVDTNVDGGARQKVSPKGVVYPHTSDKNPSFRIQKPVLLHPTRKPEDTRRPSTVSQTAPEPSRLLTNEQIAGRQIKNVTIDQIKGAGLMMELSITDQYGHQAVIVKSIKDGSPLQNQGGVHEEDELLMVGKELLVGKNLLTAHACISEAIAEGKGRIELVVAKAAPRDIQTEVTYF